MNTQTKKTKYIVIGVAIIVILGLLSFSGIKYRNYNKSLLNDAIRKSDSLIELSKKRTDSLLLLVSDSQQRADEYETLWNEAERRNKYLYGKIKKREKTLDVVDTSFVGNANYSANRINRHGTKNDTIR